MLARLGNLLRFLWAAGSTGSLSEVAAWGLKYGPLIVAVLRYIQEERTKEDAQILADKLEQAFHIAVETKDTSLLEQAVRERANSHRIGS